MRNLEIGVLSSGDRNTCMRISGCDDKTLSCNHDMELVISGMTLVFIDPYWFSEK